MKRMIFAAALASVAFSGAAALAANDNQILEARLRAVAPPPGLHTLSPNTLAVDNWKVAVQRFLTEEPTGGTKCVDDHSERLGGKYQVSYTADNKPCRIYDLSFPTLETLFAKKAVTTLPVQSFGARDYLNWMDGNYQAVLDKISAFPTAMKNGDATQLASWVKRVEFRKDRVNTLLAASTVQETGLPAQFTAADLELGDKFDFSAQEKAKLAQAVALAAKSGPNGISLLTAEDKAAWAEVIQRPQALLEQIKFKWDDARKVYDVFVEGQFLPVRGPIALVDYGTTYKLAVERTLRSLVHSALSQIIRYVPGQAQRIVNVVVEDSFMFVETAYDYQLNQLEGTLRQAQGGQLRVSLDTDSTDRALNILFGGKSDLVTAYMMAAVQKKPFDWTQFEEAGRKARYAAEKAREVSLTNMNSQMVLKDGCTMELTDSYFGVCTKNGKRTLHSMISSTSILFWNLGGPVEYDFAMPAGVTLKRSATYLLSAGASMFDLPILNYFSSYLASALKTYATAGITDQAFLHTNLYLAKQGGAIDEKKQEMLKWMYLQNINPFLPKSEALESRVIDANANLLKK